MVPFGTLAATAVLVLVRVAGMAAGGGGSQAINFVFPHVRVAGLSVIEKDTMEEAVLLFAVDNSDGRITQADGSTPCEKGKREGGLVLSHGDESSSSCNCSCSGSSN